MFHFFLGQRTTPFTTQNDVLKKYNLATNDNGDTVGMCRPMSNAYLSVILKGKNPGPYLKNDKKFLAKAIKEENRELEAEKNGHKDVDHLAFYQNNIPHTDEELGKQDLTKDKFKMLLQKHQHLLVTYPVTSEMSHEVYIGRDTEKNYSCRFFDANIKGGERKGSCDKIITEFVSRAQKEYAEGDRGFYVGKSNP